MKRENVYINSIAPLLNRNRISLRTFLERKVIPHVIPTNWYINTHKNMKGILDTSIEILANSISQTYLIHTFLKLK